MRDLFANQHRALYQFGGFRELSPITDEEWHAGLGERFERTTAPSMSRRWS
jgi:hypothetical protein